MFTFALFYFARDGISNVTKYNIWWWWWWGVILR